MRLLGIDEAGRGALIGPLVIGLVEISSPLRSAVRDSKELSRQQRESLFQEIVEQADLVDHIKIEPWEIDRENINRLEYRKIQEWLRDRGEYDGIYIDAFMDPLSLKKLGRYVIADYRADSKYPIVSAASIVAKVYRDRYIDELHARYGDFGSGYPSDPRTIEFLKDPQNFRDLERYIRKKWSTYRTLKNNKLNNF
ncbi:MAG: ribonuclease HII [Candidatus Anstonellales archaeon]